MKQKFMQLPRAVLVGKDAILKAGSVCRDLKLSGKALVISGPHTYRIAGKRLCSVLEEERDVEVALVSEASMDEVEKVNKLIHKKRIDFVAGVGGGKVIDIAKLAAEKSSLEFISVPTAASHDGIASSRASIKHNKNTVSIAARAPLGVIADTEIIRKAPYRLTASGCGDIISKFTAVKDWELAHKIKGEEYSEYAAALSLMAAKIIINSCGVIRKNGEEGVRKVVKALISSGVAMSIAGSSRPGSGSEHKFSHALDAIAPKPALHGEQCGVGSIMMMYLHGDDWEKIKNSLRKIGAPTNAEELGIEERYIIKALTKAHKIRPGRYTILGNGLTEKKAREIASATGVI